MNDRRAKDLAYSRKSYFREQGESRASEMDARTYTRKILVHALQRCR